MFVFLTKKQKEAEQVNVFVSIVLRSFQSLLFEKKKKGKIFKKIRTKKKTIIQKNLCRSPKHLINVQAGLLMQKASKGSTLGRASFLVPRAVEKMAVRGHKHLQAAMPMEKVSKGVCNFHQ